MSKFVVDHRQTAITGEFDREFMKARIMADDPDIIGVVRELSETLQDVIPFREIERHFKLYFRLVRPGLTDEVQRLPRAPGGRAEDEVGHLPDRRSTDLDGNGPPRLGQRPGKIVAARISGQGLGMPQKADMFHRFKVPLLECPGFVQHAQTDDPQAVLLCLLAEVTAPMPLPAPGGRFLRLQV